MGTGSPAGLAGHQGRTATTGLPSPPGVLLFLLTLDMVASTLKCPVGTSGMSVGAHCVHSEGTEACPSWSLWENP